MTKRIMCHFSGILVLFLWGCSAVKPGIDAEQLTIASWNVQNLFDGIDHGSEYNEFKSSAGWNSEKYQARLNGITKAFKDGALNPDILALIEVENAGVVQDLAGSSYMDYPWTFFAGDGSAGLGVLSRLPLIETRAHSSHSPEGSVPRPVVEVWADTGSGPLVLLVCHWKSKRGGGKNTEALRRAGAALVLRRLTEIAGENPGIPVIICGDLNENYDEFNRIGAAYPCALLPDSSEAAALTRKVFSDARPGFQAMKLPGFLVVSGQKPPRALFFTEPAVFSPWLEMEDGGYEPFGSQDSDHFDFLPQGSYYYDDAWETIDHFLLNAALFNQRNWEYQRFRVVAEPPFVNSGGKPQPYNPRTGNGLSDHLPIVLTLSKISE
jgi:endonuclease/exonuclease/phosphatase family metal-dependent hydrolase